jgi:hypothetical protein
LQKLKSGQDGHQDIDAAARDLGRDWVCSCPLPASRKRARWRARRQGRAMANRAVARCRLFVPLGLTFLRWMLQEVAMLFRRRRRNQGDTKRK